MLGSLPPEVLFTVLGCNSFIISFIILVIHITVEFYKIMQALVEHYSSKGWLQRVEQCVLHMDISSLDFNQV